MPTTTRIDVARSRAFLTFPARSDRRRSLENLSREFNVISSHKLPPDGIHIQTFLIMAGQDGRGTIASVRAEALNADGAELEVPYPLHLAHPIHNLPFSQVAFGS
ncbi:hypothetical protein BDFG_00072 [Blastomyces dermatitidis ATCC 26199]|nr:hypothetical protein BDFG_00072 [Blastomyces dermatitidis ATCC 26199]